jgi:prepilin-type N-terminal cleavage/methylation domain-containing protein
MSPGTAATTGFTLIELLAAMAILVVIVFIVSRVFQQAGSAWQTGVGRAEVGMKGRALADFIAQELSQAVSNDVYPYFTVGVSSADFVILGDASGPSTRAAKRVKYAFSGKKITRSVEILTAAPPASFSGSSSADLAEEVDALEFITGSMPKFVDVRIGFTNGVYQSRAYFYNRDRYRM